MGEPVESVAIPLPEWLSMTLEERHDEVRKKNQWGWVACDYPERPADTGTHWLAECRKCMIAFKAAVATSRAPDAISVPIHVLQALGEELHTGWTADETIELLDRYVELLLQTGDG